MVMELLRGGTVSEKLSSGDRIPPETALRWLRDAASALDAAHDAGVVHRDVKPGNMLLDDRSRLALADFGIARLALEDQLTLTGQVLGTASYISPEQAIGDGATAASDRYALAVVAFELLTGERPFTAENFAAQARAHVEDQPPHASLVNPELPEAVDAVLERGLAKDPDKRWATSAAVRRRAGAVAGGAAPAAADQADPPRGQGRRTAPGSAPQARLRGPAGRGLGLLAVVAVVVAVVLSGGGDDPGGERADSTSTPEATKTATREPTKTATPEPTKTATPEPTRTADARADQDRRPQRRRRDRSRCRPPAAGPGLQRPPGRGLNKALTLSQQALDKCGSSNELDPCGYALFEKGLALNRLGRPDEAIPVLQDRLNRFGDNEGGEVAKELKDAEKKAKKGDVRGGGGRRSRRAVHVPRSGPGRLRPRPRGAARGGARARDRARGLAPPTWPPRWPPTAAAGWSASTSRARATTRRPSRCWRAPGWPTASSWCASSPPTRGG